MPDLSGLPALDTAIGMVFIFFVLSTVCSMVTETIANLLGWRAKTLEDAIRNVVGDPEVKRGWKEWLGRIHKEAPGGEAAAVPAERAAAVPADDATAVPHDLTSALFDHWRIRALVRDPESTIRRRRRPSYVSPAAFSLSVAERLAEGAPPADAAREQPAGRPVAAESDPAILQRLQTALEGVAEGLQRELLQKAAANAHGTLDGFRLQVERGFDDAMERASGWYKRKVQLVLILLAAAIAIGGNVDSVRVATTLWQDGPVRTVVAAQAGKEPDAKAAAKVAANIKELQLPVGWGKNAPDNWYSPLLGWLITVAALGLGAPFWFDLLSRVARLRGSGVPERPRSLSDKPGTRRS
jgi:hypothetical protein